MELLRLGPIGHEIPVVRHDGVCFDLRPLTDDIDPEFFAVDGVERVRNALDAGELKPLDGADEMRIGAPLTRPSAIVCVGMNYAAHAREAGAEPPERPVIFFKMPSTIAGPNDPVELPPYATKADWEVELGVVIGTRTFRAASAEDGLNSVAGYVLGNDLSERRLQIEESGGQWSKGKNLPGFTPLGPWIRPAAEVDPVICGCAVGSMAKLDRIRRRVTSSSPSGRSSISSARRWPSSRETSSSRAHRRASRCRASTRTWPTGTSSNSSSRASAGTVRS